MTPRHSYSEEFEKSIIQLIEKYPGLGLRELARELEVSAQSLKYSTDLLLEQKTITVKKDGKYLRFYAKDFEIDDFEEKILNCFRKSQLLNVIMIFLNAYKKNKKEILKNQEILERIEVHSAGTITYYLNQLTENSIIEKTKEGFRLINPALIESLLKKYRPTHSIIDNFINLWTDYFQ